jgi:hypothetical protein
MYFFLTVCKLLKKYDSYVVILLTNRLIPAKHPLRNMALILLNHLRYYEQSGQPE